jgi:hypothetical protein
VREIAQDAGERRVIHTDWTFDRYSAVVEIIGSYVGRHCLAPLPVGRPVRPSLLWSGAAFGAS